jgi:hypothetical protein
MASIRKERLVNAAPNDAWDALRDFGALPRRRAPGFATDARLEGTDRIVTFANGSALREVLVDSDDDARRLVWSIVNGPYTHNNGSAQVFSDGSGTRFVWVADLLPNELADPTGEMMEQGINVIKETLEAAAAQGA